MITNPRRRHLYNIAFKRSIKSLGKSGMSGKAVAKESEKMVEQYYSDLGEMPGGDMLELLADAILSNELKEKVKTLEYNILSDGQLARLKRWTHAGTSRINVRHEVEFIPSEIDEVCSKYAEPYIYTKELPKAHSREKLPFAAKPTADYPRVEWSKKVRERDGYQCQKCKSRSGIMHAHHIENYADNEDLRYVVSNGVTLCEPCHTEFHRVYGKYRNNREQFNAFLTQNYTILAKCPS